MATNPITTSVTDQLLSANRAILAAMKSGREPHLAARYRADPLATLAAHGGPVASLSPHAQAELRTALAAVRLPDHARADVLQAVQWGCIGCETGLNIVIVGAGGIVAIVAAVALGPEALAGTAVVAALAEATGLSATFVAGVVTSAIGGGAVATAEGLVKALCEATGACS